MEALTRRPTKWIWIGLIGLLMVFFQNFTPSKPLPMEPIKPRSAVSVSKLKMEIQSPLTGSIEMAATYADFIETENPKKMSDTEILSRIRDQIVTSIEIAQMNVEGLPKDSNLRLQVKSKTQELKGLLRQLDANRQMRQELLAKLRSPSRIQ